MSFLLLLLCMSRPNLPSGGADASKIREMTYWRTASADVLQLLRKLLSVQACEAPHLMAQDIFIALSRFASHNGDDGQLDAWCTPETAALAAGKFCHVHTSPGRRMA